MASEGCAVGPDGELCDASEIEFFNDPNNDQPIALATTSSTVQPSLNSFVTKLPPPARRSNRVPHPSTKAIDPDNAMATKHKTSDAPNPNPSRRLRQASPEHKEDRASEPDTTEPNQSHYADSTNTEEDDPIDPGKAYEEVKALGDADRQVCLNFPSQFIH